MSPTALIDKYLHQIVIHALLAFMLFLM